MISISTLVAETNSVPSSDSIQYADCTKKGRPLAVM